MCLAVPSRIVKIAGDTATVDLDGVQRTISLLLLEDPKIGDYVIVHAGFAIHTINESDALESLKLLKAAALLTLESREEGSDSD